MTEIINPYQEFLGLDGNPIDVGTVYIGTYNTNPKVLANQIACYFDYALTLAAGQPLNISGGYIVRSGSPARIYTQSTAYSISVYDKKDNLVYAENVDTTNSGNTISVATWSALSTTPAYVNQIVNLIGYTTPGIGGGQFIAKSGSVTSDGGTQINSATSGVYWQRIIPSDIYDLWMFGATGVKAADEAAAALAIAAIKANGRGTLLIPSKISSTAVIPSLGLANNQSGTIIDYRADNSNAFGQEVHTIEGRDNSGGYASELRIKGKQQPSISLQTTSDGTVFGYRSGIPNNMTGVNMFKPNGDSTFQFLTDPFACGVTGDLGVMQYAQGNLNVQFAAYFGVDGNNKTRVDIAPAQFVQSTIAITAVSNTTPVVVTLASNHGIVPAQSYVTISGTGLSAVNGAWRVNVTAANQLTLINSVASGSSATGSCIVQVSVQRASLNVPKTQGGTEAIFADGKISTNSFFNSEVAPGTAPYQAASKTVDAYLHARPYVVSKTGVQQVGSGSVGTKIVTDSVVLVAGTATVTLSNDAVFSGSGTYQIFCNDLTATNTASAIPISGSQFTVNGTGTHTIQFLCVGY